MQMNRLIVLSAGIALASGVQAAPASSSALDRPNGRPPSATVASHPSTAADTLPPGGIATPENGWLRGDLHFHTNYSDDALEQGGDWVGPALRIAEYYDDPIFLQAFPEYQGNALNFIALTDHRTTEGCFDPDFKSDKLILLCSEEFGATGHAGAHNISETISHEPTDGRTANEQIQWAIDRTIELGGLFLSNHPAGDDDMWFWDVDGYEATEVWNTFWTFLGPPTDESVLDGHVEEYGVENRFIRRALREEGRGMSGQYLAFYEGHLVAGIQLAAVGGGDRHMLVMPGQPTTYVKTDAETPEGIIAGIREGHTFVSRSPAGPQVLLSARAQDADYLMGDVIPTTTSVTLRVHVARAGGGRLRLIAGPVDRDITRDELLAMSHLGNVLTEVNITSDDFTYEYEWAPGGEAWVYAMVLEDADYSDLPEDVQADLDLLKASMQFYGMRYGQLVAALLPFLDVQSVLLPRYCDPTTWDVNRTACVDVDDEFMGTFHISEPVSRILHLYRENGVITDYAVGAISSSLMVLDP